MFSKTWDWRSYVARNRDLPTTWSEDEARVHWKRFGWREGRRKHEGRDMSQTGEFPVLWKLVKKLDVDRQVIVDIGAYDGITGSNSRGFVRRGWRAVCIEPSPREFERLQFLYAESDAVRLVQAAVSDEEGESKLFESTVDAQCRTISKEDSQWFRDTRDDAHWDVVRTVTAMTALDEAGIDPADVGILLVDAEGMDLEVLRGVDFDRLRPDILMTESYLPKDDAKAELLKGAGYELSKKVGCNAVWVPGPR